MERNLIPSLLILVGPKHSGKTSTGKALASLVSGIFIDLDDEIARESGKSPRELFRQGEQIFREAELEATKAILEFIKMKQLAENKKPFIIATGGGIVDNGEAMALLQKAGTIIYLELPAQTAWKRILHSAERTGDLPPFLKTEDPEKTHRSLHERRALLYKDMADLIIDAEQEPPEARAREILNQITDKMP
uniref:Shikimate kinase n=1 Tax=Gracilinema caldarium TaxID=215591 RepID=A0A7C3EAA6_9SPIR